MQGFSRSYRWTVADLSVAATVLHNYTEFCDAPPIADVRYLVGEVLYGGHIADRWDRRITMTYLEQLLCPALLEPNSGFTLAPGVRLPPDGKYADYERFLEEGFPPDSPVLFGMPLHAMQGAELDAYGGDLFASFGRGASGGDEGGSGQGSKNEKVAAMQKTMMESLREEFVMLEIRTRVKDQGARPYAVLVLQEIERMNIILALIRSDLQKLALGLDGAIASSDIAQLSTAMSTNEVPVAWLKAVGQCGPAGVFNRKSLSVWYADLTLRWKQLEEWSAPTKPFELLPPSVWIAGFFNVKGFISATLQAQP